MTQSTALVAGVLLILFYGCAEADRVDDRFAPPASQQEPASETLVAERADFVDLLAERGFDADTIHFQDGTALVEGDMSFDVHATLADSHSDVDKGYSNGTRVVREQASIWVTLDQGSGWSLWTLDWMLAAVEAVNRWRTVNTGQWLRFNWLAPGQQPPQPQYSSIVTIRLGPITLPGGECAVASSDFPASGRAGRFITINSAYAGGAVCGVGCDGTMDLASLSWEQKVKTIVHELGHTVGLAHPFQGPLIANTSPFSASVMWQGCVDNSRILSTPSADDGLSIANIVAPRGPMTRL